MKIMKFGGTVLRSKEGFDHFEEILNQYKEEGIVLVISAFSDNTRKLEKIARIAETGDLPAALELLESFIAAHSKMAEDMIITPEINESLQELYKEGWIIIADLLKGISLTEELTMRTLDYVLSYGEFFAVHLVKHFLLEKNFDIEYVDSTKLIVSNTNFGKAQPMITETRANVKKYLKPLLSKNKIILTQGFVAKTKNKEITTMGIESSNLTATLLADLLELDEVIFWTDVEGVLNADPKLFPNAVNIPEMHYNTAYKSSLYGLKLIYPSMITNAQSNNIKLVFRSAFNPQGAQTVISKSAPLELKEKMVFFKTDIARLKIKYNNYSDYLNRQHFMTLLQQDIGEFFNIVFLPNELSIIVPEQALKLLTVRETNVEITKNIVAITVFNYQNRDLRNMYSKINEPLFYDCSLNKTDKTLRIIIHKDFMEEFIKLL